MAESNGPMGNRQETGPAENSERIPEEPGKQYSGSVQWLSPSNIALVKYWGKRENQIPENPSISITLSRSHTLTLLRYSPARKGRGRLAGFLFNGQEQPAFSGRIESYLGLVRTLFPFLDEYEIFIESTNSFPHSSGIASSASSMSALSLCLLSMERILSGASPDDEAFYRKASYAARIGSGSASRSVYPGYVLWGSTPGIASSSDEFAVPVNEMVHEVFSSMHDSILIVDEGPKAVSSSTGHSMMTDNPWSPARYSQACENIESILRILNAGDLDEFVKLVEWEALTLHSLMLNSRNGYILLKPGTIQIIDKVRLFRRETSIPVAFTLDAGPNVHLIYSSLFREKVEKFIREELLVHCTRGKWIDDLIGEGPVQITGK